MPNQPLDTQLVDRAIVFAVKAHAGTERRGKGFPYIIHPLEAMAIVATITPDQEMLAAAVLHDTVEDTDVTPEEIRREFGPRVASLVVSESDGVEGESWEVRKQRGLQRLQQATRDEKIVALGDKLSNMRAMALDYASLGDALWSRFHESDPSRHAWRYRALADAMRDELGDTAAFREFDALIEQVFGKR